MKTGKSLLNLLFVYLASALISNAHAEICDLSQLPLDKKHYEDPVCEEARLMFHSKQSLKDIQRIQLKMQMETLGVFLSRSRAASTIDEFTYGRHTFDQYCCNCVPGESCSASQPSDVCGTPDANGMCPSGTLRTICTTDDEGTICTGID